MDDGIEPFRFIHFNLQAVRRMITDTVRVQTKLENKKERESFLKETNENGVMTRPIWQLIFKSPLYSGFQKDAQINAMYLEDRIVNIPSSVR